jgi:type II secretory pathway predicted ATPase ExeA
MYEEYFGLERPPFKITPDTSLFYDGGKRGDILAALVYAIHRGEGIVKVVGEVGSGKTMLCRMLQLKLPDTVEIVYIANPSVSAEDILFVIAHELSLPVTKDASKHEVMHLLQDYLLQRHMENKQVVLFIEEAQGMPLDTLEEIRLLSNLETDENKLLQIILFGQPELDQNLGEKSIRQLRERITHNFELEPLTQDEIHNYLNFRMREVGYTGPEIINTAVAKKVEQHSEGLLRRINIIADKILLSAFAEGTHSLTSKHVTAAVNDSAFNQTLPHSKSRIFWWLGVLAIIALVFALYQSRSHWISVLAVDWPSKQEIAVENDNSITDIVPQAIETDSAKAPADAVADADMNPTLEQPVIAEQVIQGQVTQPAARLEQESEISTQQVDAEALQVVAGEPQVDVEAPSIDAVAPQIDAVVLQVNAEEQQVDAEEQQVDAVVQQADAEEPRVDTEAPQIDTVAPQEGDLAQAEAINEQVDEDRILQNALDQAASSVALAAKTSAALGLTGNYDQWLNAKLRESRDWLSHANRNSVSIQVFVRSKSAVRELVYYLRNEWPLDLSETYLYEVSTEDRSIYRVFYSEFDSLSNGRNQLDLLPDTVKRNSPYLHSVYRMQKALL